MIHALDDPQRMRNDGIRVCGAQVVGRKAFHDLVRETVRSVHGKLQCSCVSNPGAIQVRSVDALLLGQSLDLLGRAMHQHHSDVQRSKYRDVQQDVSEVLVRNDRPVYCNDECFFPELRGVLKNPAQVS